MVLGWCGVVIVVSNEEVLSAEVKYISFERGGVFWLCRKGFEEKTPRCTVHSISCHTRCYVPVIYRCSY